ncbi:MAG TPA: SDR family NAD(P)-dependent oxidoreductase [Allosphingosinicella sp.]|nr:SDR family NAD(P)-dependent oxidoreductase [Allosphingosinicella sp.]
MTDRQSLAARRFTLEDQEAFAGLSGDRNPMHLDPVYARRTQAGAAVVHGVHAALWALDAFCAIRPATAIRALKVRFDRFIYLDEPVEAVLVAERPGQVDIELRIEGARATSIAVGLGPRKSEGKPPRAPGGGEGPLPRDLSLEDLPGVAGRFAASRPDSAAAAAFPALSAAVGAEATNSLVGLSTLVGMHCPGLHSIFSKFAVELHDEDRLDGIFAYKVARVDPRFRLVTVDLDAPLVSAKVECFVRQPPVRQPALRDLAGRVRAGAFAGERALVVGGSRGLGELTAKLLALGGAEVVVTYLVGVGEAEAVASEIGEAGGACRTMKLDVRQPPGPQLAQAKETFSQLYYFATPQIFRKRSALYSPAALAEYLAVYCSGFYELCEALAGAGNRLAAFNPSSTAIDERPKGAVEYVMAKSAAEILAAEIGRSRPNIEVIADRLPRLLTDQTATVLPVESADVVDLLLPIIERMRRASRPEPG